MKVVQLAGLRTRILPDRVERSMNGARLVVLLHGYGAPGTDLIPLGSEIDAPVGTWYAFPEGPVDVGAELGYPGADARGWWPIDMVRLQTASMTGQWSAELPNLVNGLPEAAHRVAALLDALEQEIGIPSARTYLGGFSQGAMVSLQVALAEARALAGLIFMSGAAADLGSIQAQAAARGPLRTVMSHGRNDPILPFDAALQIRERLVAAGWDVRWLESDGGHAIAPEVIPEVGRMLHEPLAEKEASG